MVSKLFRQLVIKGSVGVRSTASVRVKCAASVRQLLLKTVVVENSC